MGWYLEQALIGIIAVSSTLYVIALAWSLLHSENFSMRPQPSNKPQKPASARQPTAYHLHLHTHVRYRPGSLIFAPALTAPWAVLANQSKTNQSKTNLAPLATSEPLAGQTITNPQPLASPEPLALTTQANLEQPLAESHPQAFPEQTSDYPQVLIVAGAADPADTRVATSPLQQAQAEPSRLYPHIDHYNLGVGQAYIPEGAVQYLGVEIPPVLPANQQAFGEFEHPAAAEDFASAAFEPAFEANASSAFASGTFAAGNFEDSATAVGATAGSFGNDTNALANSSFGDTLDWHSGMDQASIGNWSDEHRDMW